MLARKADVQMKSTIKKSYLKNERTLISFPLSEQSYKEKTLRDNEADGYAKKKNKIKMDTTNLNVLK